MKRTLLALVAVSLLAAPAAASAKRLASATVCGSSGCNSSSHPATLLPPMGGGPPRAWGPSRAHPFYRLRIRFDGAPSTESATLLVVPKGRWVRGPDMSWTQTSAAALGRIERLAGDLRPFPASKLDHASRLPGVPVSRPQSRPNTAVPNAAGPRSVGHGGSVPWPAIAAAAAGLLVVSGLALGLWRSRGLAIRARPIRGASERQGPL
jgi:hypothetical protein